LPGFDDVRGFITALEERGWLRRVDVELSPVLEIPEVLRRVGGRGPALLFERVAGYPGWRVAGNLFGKPEYISLGVGRDPGAFAEWVAGLLKPPASMQGISIGEALRRAKALASARPRFTGMPGHWERYTEFDIARDIPVFKCWPRDGGRYFTFAQLYYVDGEGRVGVSTYRLMVRGPRELVVHWQLHKRGRMVYGEAGGGRLPAAVAVGGDPALMFTGCVPLPRTIDKLWFASLMKGSGVKMVKLPNGVPVPWGAEVVLEGYVEPRYSREGPFGDHYGFYDKPSRLFPVFKAERLYVRREPIYIGTVVGKPIAEDAAIGEAVSRLALPVLRMIEPSIVDLWLPPHGCFHGLAIVSVRKRYPGHGKQVINLLWGLGLLSLTKIVIVVDEDIDPRDWGSVAWALSVYVDPSRDVVVMRNAHCDELDPSTPTPGLCGKLGIDATRKTREELGAEPPEPLEPDPRVAAKIDRLWDRIMGGGVGGGA